MFFFFRVNLGKCVKIFDRILFGDFCILHTVLYYFVLRELLWELGELTTRRKAQFRVSVAGQERDCHTHGVTNELKFWCGRCQRCELSLLYETSN